jgi:hypothetical protein
MGSAARSIQVYRLLARGVNRVFKMWGREKREREIIQNIAADGFEAVTSFHPLSLHLHVNLNK